LYNLSVFGVAGLDFHKGRPTYFKSKLRTLKGKKQMNLKLLLDSGLSRSFLNIWLELREDASREVWIHF
jgi:hypothetical protein